MPSRFWGVTAPVSFVPASWRPAGHGFLDFWEEARMASGRMGPLNRLGATFQAQAGDGRRKPEGRFPVPSLTSVQT